LGNQSKWKFLKRRKLLCHIFKIQPVKIYFFKCKLCCYCFHYFFIFVISLTIFSWHVLLFVLLVGHKNYFQELFIQFLLSVKCFWQRHLLLNKLYFLCVPFLKMSTNYRYIYFYFFLIILSTKIINIFGLLHL
jgi:hypothetical protein